MYTSIGDVVTEYLIERGENSQHGRGRLINLAIRGLKELNFDVTGEPVFTQLELDSNNTAAVPTGLINLIGLYLNVEHFGLVEIVESKQLAPNVITPQGEVQQTEKSLGDEYYRGGGGYEYNTGSFFQGGEFRGGIYRGVGSNPYKYRWNKDTNRFEFSSTVPKQVLLEYLGDPKRDGQKHLVPDVAVDCLLIWLNYADTRSKNISPAAKRANKQEYVNAKNLVLRRLSNITPGNLRQGFRENYALTIK